VFGASKDAKMYHVCIAIFGTPGKVVMYHTFEVLFASFLLAQCNEPCVLECSVNGRMTRQGSMKEVRTLPFFGDR
jgi:hypothetical protein